MYTYHGVPEGSMIYFISPIFRLVLVLVRCFPGNAWAEVCQVAVHVIPSVLELLMKLHYY